MTRSKRLKPVTRVAEQRERRAAVEMAEFRRFLDEQQARLQELVNYREEYTRRFEAAGRAGLDATRATDYRRILTRLGEAVAYQEQRVTGLRQEFEQIHRRWTDTRTRSAALDKVMERYRREERRDADRREQGEFDERNLRDHARRPHGSGDST